MVIESKFRKLFSIRIGIGLFLFLLILSFCVDGLRNPVETTKVSLILAFVVLFFIIYLSIGVFKDFTLKITENGIEKNSLVFRTKQFIAFDSISSVEGQKTRLRSTRGINISDGYHYTTLHLKNGNALIISSDIFENYREIVEVIKSRID
ncbi:DUF6585 family protein [Flavobacterium qiangtangense]|uniref:DUF6585 family protein n=1 Tax=Flavobacterium qiangtangense TaxID=1442595 RepID=A0ABW1PKD8_9FLAO